MNLTPGRYIVNYRRTPFYSSKIVELKVLRVTGGAIKIQHLCGIIEWVFTNDFNSQHELIEKLTD